VIYLGVGFDLLKHFLMNLEPSTLLVLMSNNDKNFNAKQLLESKPSSSMKIITLEGSSEEQVQQ
jgi:hypothetical protein